MVSTWFCSIMERNASCGNSSSPTGRWSARSPYFTCCRCRSCSTPPSCWRRRPKRVPCMNAPLRKSRPYVFWGQTQSLCETCLKLVPAKIQILDNEVWYEKRCREHGVQSTLVSTDAAYWRLCKDFIKPGDRPLQF